MLSMIVLRQQRRLQGLIEEVLVLVLTVDNNVPQAETVLVTSGKW